MGAHGKMSETSQHLKISVRTHTIESSVTVMLALCARKGKQTATRVFVRVCVFLFVFVCACVCACVRVCVCGCVGV